MRYLPLQLAATFCALTLTSNSFAQPLPDKDGQAEPATPVGSYRLTGVMETASRLLLEADGSYKWMMIVGGLDLYSEGQWTQTNGQVILGPHQFSDETPVFALGAKYSWGSEEKDAAYKMENIRLRNRAKWTCAFLEYGAQYSSSGDLAFPKDLPPQERFEAAVEIERERHGAYKKAIANYFNRDLQDDSDSAEIAARTARQHWREAVAFLADSGRAAGKTGEYQSPPLPADCLFLSDFTPFHAQNDDRPNVNWNDGVGIWVNRRERPNARLKIEAQFSFADGSQVSANSYELGFAFAPKTRNNQLQSITLTLRHNEKEYSSSFDIAPNNKAAVYEVKLDNRLFIKPPFEEFRLNIADDRLVPVDGSRGYYVKGN
ncbi:hypothetical protein [Parasphingorhabdus cellanae]|uniref:Uncharacterized protein n=1 Tax=Parasphingorhabdus cellanae TaxID=2806553 RepID=A0ABX7T5D8_9SPHN|nr:hypothetical protein [Parasphingorhabdus cellanae]QTD56809.1 hypothetical protein J4G78_04335 [Parasphingorhabdus cellanae]